MTKKQKEDVKESKNMIMLVTFKDTANIKDRIYAGFKAHLRANDKDKFSESELKRKLNEYNDKTAFLNK